MVSYRQVESRPGRGWSRPRPAAGGGSRRRLRRAAAHVLLPVLLSLGALLGAVPAQADAALVDSVTVDAAPSSGSLGTAAASLALDVAAIAAPLAAPLTAPLAGPAAEIATPGWLSRLARPVLVIGLVIVIASIVSILRDI